MQPRSKVKKGDVGIFSSQGLNSRPLNMQNMGFATNCRLLFPVHLDINVEQEFQNVLLCLSRHQLTVTYPFSCANDTGNLKPCVKRHEFEQTCGVLQDHSGPFSECHWYVNPNPYYESCIYDLCQHGEGKRVLCAAIEAYGEMCTMVGVKVPTWRKAFGCGEQGKLIRLGQSVRGDDGSTDRRSVVGGCSYVRVGIVTQSMINVSNSLLQDVAKSTNLRGIFEKVFERIYG